MAIANVSMGLKELQAWKLVKAQRELGDRRDHFTSVRDMFDLVTVVVEGRREREFSPTLEALRHVEVEAQDDGTPAAVQARMTETLKTMQMFDDWYMEIARLPRLIFR